ncbi:uncharacterized protein EKO05_0001644 [Ascochyta rabiei]|uniref:uncharacterized protein n=1 Tax=Didymella rabiei TaxID=5454 RepID=UPI0021FC5190|nr:uncharacterized protein EKO05_0001644 [Ascochyta rabiei]UPX11017.1 hypothetical protein EKO05_0001644 [Ascochyta rabiei]
METMLTSRSYVWGGVAANGSAFEEAYILTLPSFQWTRIHPAPPATVPNYGGKGWSSCDVIRNSQMIIMSGATTNRSIVECHVPNMGGQSGLLLGQESVEVENWWHAVRSDVNRYRVPDKIVELIGGNADGSATKTAPVQGWATPSLAGYWRGTMVINSRTATRTVAATPTAEQPTSQPPSRKTNVGAIAGGTVGGVVALAGIIALIFICLRRRRKQAMHDQAERNPSTGPNLHGPDMAPKHFAHASISQSSTMFASMAQSPTYSPQASPPPPSTWHGEQNSYQTSPPHQHQNSEWAQQGNQSYLQPYYPPPPDPSQSPARKSPYEISVELPEVRSPANAEMSDVRSPIGSQAPDLTIPVPVRGVL